MAGTVMQIHCPGCGVRLSVPMDAGGRPARCPACKTRFRIPDPHSMLDETVTCWLDLDQMDRDDEHGKVLDHRDVMEHLTDAGPPPLPQPKPWSAAPTAQPVDGRLPAEADAKPQPKSAEGTQPAEPEPVEEQPTPATQRIVRQLVKRGEQKTVAASEQGSQTTSGQAKRLIKFAPPPQPDKFSPLTDTGSGSYFVTQPRAAHPQAAAETNHDTQARLHVTGVGAYGVKLTFNANLLDNLAFRASMPMAGVVSQENDPGKLIARPLIWVDRAAGRSLNPGELEARYELHVRSHQTPMDVVEAMSAIDQLAPPFNQPMPYYLSRDDAGKVSVHCETVFTPRGLQCEVTIPSVRYALEWVGRVNGVCSTEYLELRQEVTKLEGGAWQAIPSQVRNRLAVWFDFEANERFLGYFNDADFARSDAGLAGLVLTDKRLVYSKHHTHGSVMLSEAGTLIAVEEGRFATLYYALHGKRRKLIHMRREDVQQLAELITGLESPIEMLVEIEEPVPSDDAGDQDVQAKLV